jgi:hypothetical protein
LNREVGLLLEFVGFIGDQGVFDRLAATIPSLQFSFWQTAMKNFYAGHYIQQGYYKSFQPSLINRPWSLGNMELIQLLVEADRAIGRLDIYSEYIPNIDLFISMHVLTNFCVESNRLLGWIMSPLLSSAILPRQFIELLHQQTEK